MDKNQELLSYYCGRLHSEWAQKKALAYLRILAEAEGGIGEAEQDVQAAGSAVKPRPRPAPRSES